MVSAFVFEVAKCSYKERIRRDIGESMFCKKVGRGLEMVIGYSILPCLQLISAQFMHQKWKQKQKGMTDRNVKWVAIFWQRPLPVLN